MTIGKSGGRSAGNRQADRATQRATPRQREHIDPPPDESPRESFMPTEEWVWTARGKAVGALLLWSLWIAMCCLLAIIVAAAFGVVE